MNKLWRRTASHKNSNEAGKHSRRLQFGNGGMMVIILIIIFLAMAYHSW